MAKVSALQVGDRVTLGTVSGTVATIVHYQGAFNVRVALEKHDGSTEWVGANYDETYKPLRASLRRFVPKLPDDIRYPY